MWAAAGTFMTLRTVEGWNCLFILSWALQPIYCRVGQPARKKEKISVERPREDNCFCSQSLTLFFSFSLGTKLHHSTVNHVI